MTLGLQAPPLVLVVDDDEIMREVLAAVLLAEGYEVLTAASGEEALHRLAQPAHDIRIILTDLQMPGLRGADLSTRLRALLAPGAVLIGMSGSEPRPEERRTLDAFLHKPFDMEEFADAIHHASTTLPVADHEPGPPAAASTLPASEPALDPVIYGQLAAKLPASQLNELYRITLDDVTRRLAAIRSASDRNDLEFCRQEAHAIKGGCGMVGARRLSALAARIEAGAPPNTLFEEFAAECNHLRRMLNASIAV